MFLVRHLKGKFMLELLIGLASGAVGGNIAGKVMNSGMGTMGRSLTGIIGGTGLAALAPMIPGLDGLFAAPADGGASMSAIIGSLASGGVGGGLLTAIMGKFMGNKG
ncbi:MAG: hypothetical protein EX271_12990 [Acidimicrobiales bacterium]|nr:hypothetical protein [Hyphomonadaceae bacterium]RZV35307.1 MAG: hypothetical protein EX271_12990 [Acidimicrobiales bacterium]